MKCEEYKSLELKLLSLLQLQQKIRNPKRKDNCNYIIISTTVFVSNGEIVLSLLENRNITLTYGNCYVHLIYSESKNEFYMETCRNEQRGLRDLCSQLYPKLIKEVILTLEELHDQKDYDLLDDFPPLFSQQNK